MSYQVLARKWRPHSFEALVGQAHVLRALTHALDHDRLHHAFLFTGTRGVGKTTIARILAKSLNCEQGVSSHPCGECATCREIDEGRFVDLIEVDAASRTKVDETRDLLDNVQYAPTRGRYKVYLIDEVHMFSNHSFNALLKTLEEPPPHVKFLLATTDPQKLPVTILSRCLQFNLRRLPAEHIEAHLATILEKEGVTAEAAALHHLARAADGSVRDALSLLDQAIAFGGGQVLQADVSSMLGSIERDHIFRILNALAAGDGAVLLDTVEQLAQQAPDYSDALAELITTLHRLALLNQLPDAWDESMGDQAQLQALLDKLSAEDLQLYYQIALTGRRDLPLAPEPRSGFEMILLRMLAFRPLQALPTASGSAPPPEQKMPSQTTDNAPQAQAQARAQSHGSQPAESSLRVATGIDTSLSDEPQHKTPAAAVVPRPSATPASPGSPGEWHEVAAALNLVGALAQLVANCVLESHQGDDITLALAASSAPMLSRERENQLRDALSQYYGRPIRLTLAIKEASSGESPAARDTRMQTERLAQAQISIAEDPNVQSIIDAFDGQVRPNSVEPID